MEKQKSCLIVIQASAQSRQEAIIISNSLLMMAVAVAVGRCGDDWVYNVNVKGKWKLFLSSCFLSFCIDRSRNPLITGVLKRGKNNRPPRKNLPAYLLRLYEVGLG